MEKTWTISYLDGTSIEVEAESFAKAAEQAKDMLFYADLHGADLSFAYLDGADLSGADLSGAYLSGAKGLPRLV